MKKYASSSLMALSALVAASSAFVMPGNAEANEQAPVIRAKVSLQEGLFAFNPRCDYRIAATTANPVLYRLPFVESGEPLGFETRFGFSAATRADGNIVVTVQQAVYDHEVLDRHTIETKRVLLAPKGKESVTMSSQYEHMQINFKVELSDEGESREIPAPRVVDGRRVLRKMPCGQVFIEPMAASFSGQGAIE